MMDFPEFVKLIRKEFDEI